MSQDTLSPTIDLEKALRLRDQGVLFVDARSPDEFAEATIPGSINVPLLDNEQRTRVGTVYKQQGALAARRLGVELISPHIPLLVEQVASQAPDPQTPVIVFCWRGGMRSRALTTFLNLAGVRARQMEGGHKAFRTRVQRFLEEAHWGRIFVLRGMTGVGKTRLLRQLADDGLPVIDLEGLACHRGSAFGALGLDPQPTQKMFEAFLWDALRHVPCDGFVLAEGESRHIGKLQLPVQVHKALQVETSLWITAEMPYRVDSILQDYPTEALDKEAIARPIHALTRKLGKKRVAAFLQLLEEDRWELLVEELMRDYYDPLYQHTFPDRRIEVAIDCPEGYQTLLAAIDALKRVAPGEEP